VRELAALAEGIDRGRRDPEASGDLADAEEVAGAAVD
jgi:hypothetical protein